MRSFSEIQEGVIRIVAVISGIPREQIRADSTFEELELDSLARIEVLVELEREFGTEAPEDQDDEEILKPIQSVTDASRLVEKNLAAQDVN